MNKNYESTVDILTGTVPHSRTQLNSQSLTDNHIELYLKPGV